MTGFEKVFLRGLVFTPEECYVNRIVMRPISALQRSAMSVDGDEPNACVSGERNVYSASSNDTHFSLTAKGVGLFQRPRYPP